MERWLRKNTKANKTKNLNQVQKAKQMWFVASVLSYEIKCLDRRIVCSLMEGKALTVIKHALVRNKLGFS